MTVSAGSIEMRDPRFGLAHGTEVRNEDFGLLFYTLRVKVKGDVGSTFHVRFSPISSDDLEGGPLLPT